MQLCALVQMHYMKSDIAQKFKCCFTKQEIRLYMSKCHAATYTKRLGIKIKY